MIAVNPVLRRELMERWRGRRAIVTLTLYLTVLALLLYAIYRVGVALLETRLGFGFGGVDSSSAGPALGRLLFEGLLFCVLLLVLFVSPGYAAAQLSSERERRTLPLLQVTLLRPSQIVLGKLGASVAWLTLLVLAALPLGAAALFLGGITLGELLRSIVSILVVAVGVAGVAIGISSLTRRTTAAVVLTYAAVLVLSLGTVFAAGVEFVLRFQGDEVNRTPLALYANPFVGLADAATSSSQLGGASFAASGLPSPLSGIAAALPNGVLTGGGGAAMAVQEGQFGGGFNGGGFQQFGPLPDPEDVTRPPVWLWTGGLYLAFGLLGVAVATRRVRTFRMPVAPGGRRRRRGRRGRTAVPDGPVGTPPELGERR